MAGFEISEAVAFVTGASSGIGRELALSLARAGARVFLTGRDAARLAETEAAVRELGASAASHTADLTDSAARAAAFAACVSELGRVDLLVNCAGVLEGADHESLDAARAERMIAINLTAPSHLCALALPGMKARKRGCIVNVSSMSGRLPIPFTSLYAATKAGLAALSEALSREVAGSGILVVCAFPGATDTSMLAGNDREAAARAGIRIAPPGPVAERIVRAIGSGKTHVYPGAMARAQAVVNVLLPAFADRELAKRSAAIRRFFVK